MTFNLFIQLTFGIFSLKKGNMRSFNTRRILMVLFFLPFFIGIFFIHRFFLSLDFLFFPRFRKQNIKAPVFIVAAPRSATTFLLSFTGLKRKKIHVFQTMGNCVCSFHNTKESIIDCDEN